MEITLKSIRTIFTKSKKNDQSDTSTEHTSTSQTVNNPSSTNGTAVRIHNTPFTLVGSPQRGYFIAYGMAQITNPYKTKKQALKALEYNHWEIICNMVAYTVENWAKIKEQAINTQKTEQLPLWQDNK